MECITRVLLAFHYGVLEGDMAIFITKTVACKLLAMLRYQLCPDLPHLVPNHPMSHITPPHPNLLTGMICVFYQTDRQEYC